VTGPGHDDLPAHLVDRSVRVVGADERILIGGSPLRLFRLTDAGAELFRRVRRVAPCRATPGERSLVARWVAAGLLHPLPAPEYPGGPTAALTVVVPVRDRPAGLSRLLDSLALADAPPDGVVVVDDGSVDELAVRRVVEGAQVAGASVRLVRRERSGGPAAARNDGLGLVDTELVAFLDSDCRVATDWLAPLRAQLVDPAVAAVAPRVRAAAADGADRGGVLVRYERGRSPLDMGPDPARVAPGTRVSYVPSAALVLRTAVVRGLGGFEPGLRVGEDVDLIWRLVAAGHAVRYEPRAQVHHEVRGGLGAWIRQRVGYGTSAAGLDLRHPGAVAPVVMSPWSAGVWALAAVGAPGPAAVVAAGTTLQLGRRLPGVPPSEIARLGVGGHLGAGGQLLHALVRVWWPLAVPAAVVSRRARRLVLLAAGWTLWRARREGRRRVHGSGALGGGSHGGDGGDGGVVDDLDPLRAGALALLDEASYGAGVWLGCVRARSLRALLPRLARSS